MHITESCRGQQNSRMALGFGVKEKIAGAYNDQGVCFVMTRS